MGFLNWFRGRREKRSGYDGGESFEIGHAPRSDAGLHVTPENSIQSTAVYASVRVIADTIATLPLVTYQRNQSDGRDRAPDHPIYRLLHDSPNEFQTTNEWLDLVITQLLLFGNHYSFIEKSAARPVALLPLNPSTTKPKRERGLFFYEAKVNDLPEQLDPSEVLHIKMMSFDGLKGISPIEKCATAVGLDIVCTKFGARYFSQGSQPGGILSHPQKLSEDAKKNLREAMERRTAGLDNAFRFMLLQEGMSYTATAIPNEAAQFLETRQFQAREIAARIFKVPPHLIGDMEAGASFASIEQQNISFYQNTIRPHLVRIEQAINQKLFLEAEKDEFYAEFVVEGLLRGDLASQDTSFATGVTHGWYSVNEVRRAKNLAPIEGGDVHQFPKHADAIGKDGSDTAPPPAADSDATDDPADDGGRALPHDLRPVVADAARRVLTKERNAVRRAAKKLLRDTTEPHEFATWAAEWYEGHRATVAETWRPVEATLRTGRIDTAVESHVQRSLDDLAAALETADPYEAVVETVGRWATRHTETSWN